MATTDIDQVAAGLGVQFADDPFDFFRPDSVIRQRRLNAIKDKLELLKISREQDARRQIIATTALSDTDATPEEVTQFTPGRTFASQTAPRYVAADPGPALRAEALDAAVARNAPAVAEATRSIAFQDAGIDESKIARARAAAALARLRGGQADEQDYRFNAIKNIADDPELDPLLRADIAQDKPVSRPDRVEAIVNGKRVYVDAIRRPDNSFAYAPALDEYDQPLEVPVDANGRSTAPTALQKNTAFVARVLFPGDPQAESRAVTMLTQLKGKSPEEAWARLVSEVSKMQYGRYGRDPQRLYEKTKELWLVSRPGEPVPVEPVLTLPAGAQGQPAAPRPAAPAPAPPQGQRQVGAIYQTPRGPMKWTGTGWLPGN